MAMFEEAGILLLGIFSTPFVVGLVFITGETVMWLRPRSRAADCETAPDLKATIPATNEDSKITLDTGMGPCADPSGMRTMAETFDKINNSLDKMSSSLDKIQMQVEAIAQNLQTCAHACEVLVNQLAERERRKHAPHATASSLPCAETAPLARAGGDPVEDHAPSIDSPPAENDAPTVDPPLPALSLADSSRGGFEDVGITRGE